MLKLIYVLFLNLVVTGFVSAVIIAIFQVFIKVDLVLTFLATWICSFIFLTGCRLFWSLKL